MNDLTTLCCTAYRAVTLALGGSGVLCLYASCINPTVSVSVDAIVLIGTATAMVWASPWPEK